MSLSKLKFAIGNKKGQEGGCWVKDCGYLP